MSVCLQTQTELTNILVYVGNASSNGPRAVRDCAGVLGIWPVHCAPSCCRCITMDSIKTFSLFIYIHLQTVILFVIFIIELVLLF